MTRRPIALLLALIAALCVAPGVAEAKAKKAGPTITSVSPMAPKVGDTLTIRGRGFSKKASKNTVIFRSASGKSSFVKPLRASRTKIVLKLPTALERAMSTDRSGKAVATRFKIRVLAGRFGKFTSRARSPLIGPAPTPTSPPKKGTGGGGGGGGGAALAPPPDCDNDATPDSTDTDDDNDLLPDTTEATIGTDRCNRDTDGDGVEDGYEEQSAIDLNHDPRTPPLPYPGKRPYPNALDPTDAGTDYDGDGLTQADEETLWLKYSSDGVLRVGRPTDLTLTYSDGLQKSIDPAPAAPVAPALDAWVFNQDGDGELSDDERDADGDHLPNWSESHGQGTEGWWDSEHDGNIEPLESNYPGITFPQPKPDDADSDGDGVLDGADDTDHDGLSDEFELMRPANWAAVFQTSNEYAYVQPFNPCKPFNSERCHKHPPFGYYDSDQEPPIGPDPPSGYPGSAPPTPNG
jgi:hypothetical protein